MVLPCSCENRDTSKHFFWQMDNTKETLSVFSFTGRVDLFYLENQNNCSILLKNITLRDHGSYRCYYRTDTLQYCDVDLNVSGK